MSSRLVHLVLLAGLPVGCVEYTPNLKDSPPDGGTDDSSLVSVDTGDDPDTAPDGCTVEGAEAATMEADMCAGSAVGEGNSFVELEWSWTGSSTNPAVNDVVATPAVAPLWNMNPEPQIDRNDAPGIVFVASDAGSRATLVAVSFDDSQGWELSTIEGRAPDWNSTPAIGDLEKDGNREILVVLQDGHVAALYADGSVRWVSDATVPGGAALGLFDMDDDEVDEIVAGRFLIDHRGGLLTMTSGADCPSDSTLVADADLDGAGEWIAGGQYIARSGAVERTIATSPFCFPAPWYETGDATLRFLGTNGSTSIRRVTQEGTTDWSYTATATIGPPAVGDVDGDGTPEACFTFAGDTYLYDDINGVSRLVDGTDDGSITGCVLTDLDGDGAMEVIRAGGGRASIVNVHDNKTWLEETGWSNSSGFATPAISDVDSDGSAEIIFPADDIKGGSRAGIYVYGNPDRGWIASSRRTWPQHAYDPVQVDDDGYTVAAGKAVSGARYRCQASLPSPRGIALEVSPLDACADSCDPLGTGKVSFVVRNRGGVASTNTLVSVVDGTDSTPVTEIAFGTVNSGTTTASAELDVDWATHPNGFRLTASGEGWSCQPLPDAVVPPPCR